MLFVGALVWLSISGLAVGCTLISTPEAAGMRWSGPSGSAASGEVDTGAVLEALNGWAFSTSSTFTHATKAAYASKAAPGAWVQEWVSSDAYAAYSSISPDASGSGVVLPAGTTIVRAVYDAQAQPTEVTVMVKGPSGYNPDLGDWWFGLADANGVFDTNDGGAMMGRLTQCYSCHQPRSADDFLFGVPTDDRP
ncbi:MAG TPA: cytochrome P460 family protein [Polyangiaceae bacterium]|nr:cytochrome P460 family protein [Polyangiaceae bacterium]